MLNKLNEQIRDCLQHAEHCAREADIASSAELRDDYLMLERRWLSLAQTYHAWISDRIEPPPRGTVRLMP